MAILKPAIGQTETASVVNQIGHAHHQASQRDTNRGHRWLAMLESGDARSITELAAREKIDNSYMCRMLNLTTLAPDIVAAILDETLPPHVTVHELAIRPPVLWDEQRERIGVVGGVCRTGRPHPDPCEGAGNDRAVRRSVRHDR